MRARWLIAMVAGCTGGTTPAPARPARTPEPTPWAVAEPTPRKPERPPATEIGLARDLAWISDELARTREHRDVVVIDRNRRFGPGGDLDVADRDFWDACVRDVVRQQPEPMRRPLAALVNTYATSCDGEGRVVLERPLDLDGRERRAGSGVAIVGRFGADQIDLILRIDYCGDEAVDRVTLTGRDASWASQRLEFQRGRDAACVHADIPLTRAVARAAHALADGQASLRVEGPHSYDVIAIDEDAQRLLRIALDVRDARDALDTVR